MPFSFVLSILVLVAGLILLAVTAKAPHGKSVFGWLVIVLAGLIFAVSCVSIVPTREIGILTSFGKPVSSLSNGIHLKAPWQKVRLLDGAIQTDNYTGKSNCTDIRIGNESTACVDNSVRWRIRIDAGTELYQDYREMENIRDSLVTRELKAALNEALSDYNPLAEINADDTAAHPDLNQFAEQVTNSLRERVGRQIEVLNVIIPIIRFDKQTQDKINLYQAEVANTRIAQQREQTAKAQAQANRNLADSVTNDPNVLVAQCLDILGDMVKGGQNVPIGFSCWPGGSGSTVVLPSAGTQAKN